MGSDEIIADQNILVNHFFCFERLDAQFQLSPQNVQQLMPFQVEHDDVTTMTGVNIFLKTDTRALPQARWDTF